MGRRKNYYKKIVCDWFATCSPTKPTELLLAAGVPALLE
jgi:hypothetical protein